MQQSMASNSTATDPAPATTTVSTVITKPSSVTPPPPRPTKPPQFHHRHLPLQHPHIQPATFQAQAQTQTQTHWGKTPPDPIRYPLASSGRGLLSSPRFLHHLHPPLPLPEQVQVQAQVPNSGAFPQILASTSQHPFLHPSSLHQYSRLSSSPTPPVRGVSPLCKAATSPYTVPDSNIPKDFIDKGTDDTLVTLRDRKVRISDGASLYALCRSWLRNGYLEENQPQYGDVLKSLGKPLPLPLPLPESSPLKRKEWDDEMEVDEAEKVETLTTEELLSRHVKRAKKVRARLREERLQRIERYKGRLALLLPPLLQE